jgi:hypothetical protein
VRSRIAGSVALVLLLAAAAGCATSRPASALPESQAALALPERDPTNHGTPRDRLLVTGVEQVTTAASVDADRRPILVRVLAPDLTPAQGQDVRLAFEDTPWAPPPERTGLAGRIGIVRVRSVDPKR